MKKSTKYTKGRDREERREARDEREEDGGDEHCGAKAVILVHLYGKSVDIEPILEVCGRYGVPLIEGCGLATDTHGQTQTIKKRYKARICLRGGCVCLRERP